MYTLYLTLSARGPSIDSEIWISDSESRAVHTHNMGIQMKRKELTKTFIMISNWKTFRSPWFIHKYFSALRVKIYPSQPNGSGSLGVILETHPDIPGNPLQRLRIVPVAWIFDGAITNIIGCMHHTLGIRWRAGCPNKWCWHCVEPTSGWHLHFQSLIITDHWNRSFHLSRLSIFLQSHVLHWWVSQTRWDVHLMSLWPNITMTLGERLVFAGIMLLNKSGVVWTSRQRHGNSPGRSSHLYLALSSRHKMLFQFCLKVKTPLAQLFVSSALIGKNQTYNNMSNM